MRNFLFIIDLDAPIAVIIAEKVKKNIVEICHLLRLRVVPVLLLQAPGGGGPAASGSAREAGPAVDPPGARVWNI